VVLAVTQRYLTDHPAAVANLVKGQLQADKLLAASPVSAQAAFQQAVAAGLIRPVTNWTAIFDLTQLNSLLRSTGHNPVRL
jgi:ABC-type nitrate/sulfonate/bicarbonate transport system substrate-binding protein